MEEVAVVPMRGADIGAMGGHAVDHGALRSKCSYHPFDLMKMPVDLDLLRRFEPQADQIPVDCRLQINSYRGGVPHHLRRRLIEREHENALATPHPLHDGMKGD